MDNLKYGVALSGLAGLVGCFLPLGAKTLSFFALRSGSPGDSYAIMAGYLVALIMGALAIARPPMLRWQALVAITAFAFVLIKMRDLLETFLVHGNVGAKLMVVAPILGLLFAIGYLARPKLTAKASS
jgi:hypothetical protein